MPSQFFTLFKISNIKNLFLRGIAKISTFLPKHPASNQKFLLVSTTGLGDTLWATPAIRALRYSYPNAYIGILTTSLGKEVLKNNPHLNEIFVLKKPMPLSALSLLPNLRKKQIGTTIIFHASQRIILPFCAFVGSSQIIANQDMNKGLDFILTKAIKKKPMHEIQRRLDLVSALGAKPVDFHMEIFCNQEDKACAKKILEEIPTHIPIVGMHAGAKDKNRQWPPEHFIALGKLLQDNLGCQLVLTGGPSEKKLIQQIAQALPLSLALPSNLSIHLLAALIQKFSCFVVGDTGPMHVALAVKTPTVALFCPSEPKLFGPYFASKCHVIKKHHTCTPCLKKKCREPFCMRQISPAEVFTQVSDLIQRVR